MSIIGLDIEPVPLVLQSRRDFKWSFQNLDEDGSPLNYPAGDLFFELDTGGQHNAVQRVSVLRANGGTYKLGLDGHWSADIDYYDVTNAPFNMGTDISDAIEGIDGVGVGNVEVRSVSLRPEWRFSLNLNTGVNEVQRITISDSVTMGDFKLSYGLDRTGAIDFGAEASEVESALEGLSGIGAGNVSVSKMSDHEYIVEFIEDLANEDVLQIGGIPRGLGFGLRSGTLGLLLIGNVQVETVTRGTAVMGEKLVNTLNDTINAFFDQFENLLGVDITFTVTSETNVKFVVTSRREFAESELITFVVDVTANAIKAFFNGVSYFLGVFDTINIDFRWNNVFEIEFVGDLANTPVAQLSVDIDDLEAADGDQEVIVEVIRPGKERLTYWYFDIEDDTATIKVESEEVDKVTPRTKWQLVFLPDGEPAGGVPVARGNVVVQE